MDKSLQITTTPITFAIMQQIDFQRIHYLLCCLLAFVIPFPFRFAPVAIILVAVAWVFSGQWRSIGAYLKTSPVLVCWIIFYGLHLAGYFYSHNKIAAGFELERKLSFWVLPLVLYSSFYRSSRRFAYLLLSFMAGLCAIALWCLARATFLFAADSNLSHFFYHALAGGTDANAVYTSWYVVCALVLLLFYPWQKIEATFSRNLRWAMGVLLGIFLILLASRLLLVLFFVVVLPVYILRAWRSGRLPAAKMVWLGGTLALLLLLLAATRNPVSGRFHEILNKNAAQAFYPDYHQRDQQFNNLTLRLFLWRVGMDNMREHRLWAFGAGIGDVADLQNERMAALGIKDIYNKQNPSQYAGLNLHNMYMQTLVSLGIPGLLLFCYLVGWPLGLLRLRWQEKLPLFLVLAVAALFMLQEAALQTQAGIVFYLFCSVAIYNRYQAVKS